MVIHVCEKCNKEFNKKSNYLMHINKKFDCSNKNIKITLKNSEITPKNSKKTEKAEKLKNSYINSDLICKYCKKLFSRKDNLKKHFNRCKVKKQDENEKDLIFKQLLEKDEQIKQLIEQNKQLFEQNKEIVKMNTEIVEKYDDLLTKSKKLNKNCKAVQNIQNNTTNIKDSNINIQVIQFGKEDLNKIDKKQYLKIFNNARSLGHKFFTDVVKTIHFNPDYPEFQNIYISDINREKCMIHDGENWKLFYLDKNNNIISEIIEKTVDYSRDVNDLINEKHDTNFVKTRTKDINKYLNMCDDNHIQDLNDEYEENPSDKTKKDIKRCTNFKSSVEDNIKLLLYNEKNSISQNKN